MKKKKLITLLLLCLLLVCCISSCTPYSSNSLDDYIKKLEGSGYGFSEVEIDDVDTFLPSKTFLIDYKYTIGTYNYKDYGLAKGIELVILTLEHNDIIYIDAKNYCDSHMDLSLTNTFQVNNYYFAENMAHPKHYGYGKYSHLNEKGENKHFPRWFTMFCYNDDKNTLIFLGFSDSYQKDGEKNKILSDWSYFLNKYYGKYYDFNN